MKIKMKLDKTKKELTVDVSFPKIKKEEKIQTVSTSNLLGPVSEAGYKISSFIVKHTMVSSREEPTSGRWVFGVIPPLRPTKSTLKAKLKEISTEEE